MILFISSRSDPPEDSEGPGLPRCNIRRNPRDRCLFRPEGSAFLIARAEGPGARPVCQRKAQRAGHSTAFSSLPCCRMVGPSALKFPMRSLSRAFSPGWKNGWPFRPEEAEKPWVSHLGSPAPTRATRSWGDNFHPLASPQQTLQVQARTIPVRSITCICRPSPVCGESMHTSWPSRLERGCVSHRHSPTYSGGEYT